MKNHFYKMISVIVSNKHNQNPISTGWLSTNNNYFIKIMDISKIDMIN